MNANLSSGTFYLPTLAKPKEIHFFPNIFAQLLKIAMAISAIKWAVREVLKLDHHLLIWARPAKPSQNPTPVNLSLSFAQRPVSTQYEDTSCLQLSDQSTDSHPTPDRHPTSKISFQPCFFLASSIPLPSLSVPPVLPLRLTLITP